MAEYHVKVSADGEIKAGLLTKTGKLSNATVVTQEALAAARDHLLILSRKENKSIAYCWNYPNNKTIVMKLEEIDTDKVGEGE